MENINGQNRIFDTSSVMLADLDEDEIVEDSVDVASDITTSKERSP